MTLTVVPAGSLLLDYSFARGTLAARLWEAKQAGYAGAIRYISGYTDKDLDAAERDVYAANGMGLGLVWQTSGRPDVSGPNGGLLHAHQAVVLARDLGYPPGGVIWWTADSPGISWASARGYATNFWSVVSDAGYQVGCYGPHAVWSGAITEGLAGWSWQPETWTPNDHQDADVIQMVNSRRSDWGGSSVDENQCRRPVPLWFPGGQPAQQFDVFTPTTAPVRVDPPQPPIEETDSMLYAYRLPDDPNTIHIRNPADGTVRTVNSLTPAGATPLETYEELLASAQCRQGVNLGWNANWALAVIDGRV